MAGWIACAWVVVFWRLGYMSLLDPDEAHYAQLTREMLRSHSWLVPLLDGRPYIDKPIFFHWLQGLAFTVLGESELATRLPSAMAAIGLFAITRWVGRKLFDERVGNWAGLMLASMPATFALSSVGMIDMVYALFLFGGVGCLLVAGVRGRNAAQYSGFALLTLAVITKGPAAFVLVAIFAAIVCAAGGRHRRALLTLRWDRGIAICVLAGSPWFLWMWHRYGRLFFDSYVLAGNLWYFTRPDFFSARKSDAAFYLRTFAGAFFPWSWVAAGCLLDIVRRIRRAITLSTAEVLLWSWLAAVLGLFSAAGFKLDHYIFPAAPACCLLAAHGWRTSGEAGRVWTTRSIATIGGAFVVTGLAGGFALFSIDLDLPVSVALLPASLAVGGAIFLVRRRLHGVPTPAVLVTTLICAYAVIVALGFPVLEATRPGRSVGAWLSSHTSPSAPVGLYRLDRWRASTRFYADRRLIPLQGAQDVRAFIEQYPDSYIVMRRREFIRLRQTIPSLQERFVRPAVVGTSGRVVRRQEWGFVMIVAPET